MIILICLFSTLRRRSLPRLSSADLRDMIVLRIRTVRYGPRSFRVTDTSMWNTLPSHLTDINISREQRIQTLYILYSGWGRTIYIAGMGVGVARDAVRHVSL